MEPKRGEDRKLEKRLLHLVGKAIQDFDLIREGDRVAVALSGGKDSFGTLRLLSLLRERAPVAFELSAITIHHGADRFRTDILEEYMRRQEIGYLVERTKITTIIEERRREGSPYCSFCARLRRGALYGAAQREGWNKIALGHHLDDVAEMVLSIDLAPTMLALAGESIAEEMQGRDFSPLVRGEQVDWRRDWYYEHTYANPPVHPIPRSEGVRTATWKYVRYTDFDPAAEQLFDLQADPLEEHNLAAESQHQSKLDELRKRCDHLRATLN